MPLQDGLAFHLVMVIAQNDPLLPPVIAFCSYAGAFVLKNLLVIMCIRDITRSNKFIYSKTESIGNKNKTKDKPNIENYVSNSHIGFSYVCYIAHMCIGLNCTCACVCV